MAKKYLDDTGMSYFWGKLKDYFQAKLVSGTNIKTINNETLLGSGDISVTSGFEVRSVTWSATVPANGAANTNLKTLIDADLPSGKRFLAIAGFTTNDQSLLLVGAYYNSTSNYSLQVRNISSSSLTKNTTIFYLCASA